MPSSSSRNYWTMILLSLVCMFLFADQNVMAPNLTQIGEEFGFGPDERDTRLGGDISLVFWLLGGFITLPIGLLADLVPRKRLFVAIVLIGEIPCLLTGFVRNYDELFWARAATGIGIGGAIPLAFSLLGDLFSRQSRAAASAAISFAIGMGIVVGQLAAGLLGPTYGWRMPFIVVAIPNFVLGILFWLTVREPKRGAREDALRGGGDDFEYSARITPAAILQIFRIRTNLMAFLQGVPGTVPWGVFFIFLNDFYVQEKGYSVEVATTIITALGGAALLGGLVGGLIGNRLYNIRARYLPLLCATSTLLGVIPVLVLINYPSQMGVSDPSPTVPLLIAAVAGFVVTITGPNVKAMLLNVNTPETRGSVMAVFNLADDLGRGFGPMIISLFIVAVGRLWAFNIATLFWIFCALALFAMVWTFPRDEAILRARLSAQVGSGGNGNEQ